MIPPTTTRMAKGPGESAYPSLWVGLVAAWLPPQAPKSNVMWDYSGNRNHGLPYNGSTPGPGAIPTGGKQGFGYIFDGSDDAVRGQTAGNNFPFGGTARSQVWWMKGSWSGADLGLLHWGTDGTGSPQNWQSVAGSAGDILWGNGYGYGIADSVRTVNDNKWHHIACTNSGTNCQIWIDGVLDKNQTIANAPNTGQVNPWRWGQFMNGFGSWPGVISDSYLYSRRLLDGEIRWMANGANPFIKRRQIMGTSGIAISGRTFISSSG